MVSILVLLYVGGARAAETSVPRFDLPALDGSRYTERSLLGRPTLMVFWASWCPVCQVELPKLHALFDDAKGRGLQVLAIGFADREDKIRSYVQSHRDIFDFPVLYDDGDAVAKRFGVVGTPSIYLINGSGQIEYATWLIDDPALGARLETLLKAPRPGGVQTSQLQRITHPQMGNPPFSLKTGGRYSGV